jgi:glycosyltransferase involved in cell wall biosynthesis
VRILFVNEKLGWFGGVEQNISDTVEGLNLRGVECFLAWGEQTAREPERYRSLFRDTAPCREVGATKGEALADLADRLEADVVYLHKIPRVPLPNEWRRRLPVVRMVHDHDLCCPRRHKYFVHNAHVCHHPAGWRCWLDLAWLDRDRAAPLGFSVKALAPHRRERERNQTLDLCLVGSQFMHAELVMNGFAPSQVKILPPVVRRLPRDPKPVGDDPHIVFVGQLIRGKGVDLLIDALARIQVPWRATIVGEGNARPALEAQAQGAGLGERIRFAGWVANTAIDEYNASARVLAVPARWPEPFGMIGLEAMHHARPIVAFGTGGIPDWLEDGRNGFLVAERDCDGFALALTRLLADRQLAEKLGLEGWRRVRDEFSFEAYLDRLQELLKKVAA